MVLIKPCTRLRLVAFGDVDNKLGVDEPPVTPRDRVLHLIRTSDPDKVWTSLEMLAAVESGLLPEMTRNKVSGFLVQLYDKGLLERVRCGKYKLRFGNLQNRRAERAPTAKPSARYASTTPPDDTPCEPIPGDVTHFQWRARTVLKVVDAHLWMTSTCATPRCLAHLAAVRPRTLGYRLGICVYCGLIADTQDHLMPEPWTGGAERNSVLTVPACRECNSAINDSFAFEVDVRRRIAHEYISNKYRKHIAVAEAHKVHLQEYGPNLRSVIQASIDVGEVTRTRLEWPPHADYDHDAAWAAGIEDPYAFGLLSGLTDVEAA